MDYILWLFKNHTHRSKTIIINCIRAANLVRDFLGFRGARMVIGWAIIHHLLDDRCARKLNTNSSLCMSELQMKLIMSVVLYSIQIKSRI